jgi:small subunit ribosomal protein S9
MPTARKSTTKAKPHRKPHAKAAPEVVAAPVVHHAPAHTAHTANRKAKFLEAVGRRKSAIARVRYFPEGDGTITVNGKPLAAAFPWFEYQAEIVKPLTIANLSGTATISAKVIGGGPRGQVGAIRLGIARVLLQVNPEWRTTLKSVGLLKRDPRVKERKKYGLKRARRAPQWQKR